LKVLETVMGRNLDDVIKSLPADRQGKIAALSRKKIEEMISRAVTLTDSCKQWSTGPAAGETEIPGQAATKPSPAKKTAVKKRTTTRAKGTGA